MAKLARIVLISEPVTGLDERELAAVRAGLRLLFARLADVLVCLRDINDLCSNSGALEPLSPRDIDALSERLRSAPLPWPATDPYEFAARLEGWTRDADADGAIFQVRFGTSTEALEHGGATYDSWQSCCEQEGIGAVL